jgi:precorrin-6B methylase 2
MHNLRFFFICIALTNYGISQGQYSNSDEIYSFKKGDINGIGKWYMGREIAHVMGFQGFSWLERSKREKEENVSKLIENLGIKLNDIIADVGAGSVHHVFKIAPLAKKGLIYAVDIQNEMLIEIQSKIESFDFKNIKIVLGSEKSIHLPKNSINKILMVDVYHEFNYPKEMLESIKNALKPDGQLFLVEYKGEDPKIPIKKIHKMTEKQAVKEMEVAGFVLKENIKNLPWQHCMVFIKKPFK